MNPSLHSMHSSKVTNLKVHHAFGKADYFLTIYAFVEIIKVTLLSNAYKLASACRWTLNAGLMPWNSFETQIYYSITDFFAIANQKLNGGLINY